MPRVVNQSSKNVLSYIGEANTDLSDDSCVRLKSLLELAEFEEQLSCATSPTALNNMLARTPEELAWFEAFDARLEVGRR